MDTTNATAIQPAETPKKTLEELKTLSKEELLKMVFDESISNMKEKGHAQYASSPAKPR